MSLPGLPQVQHVGIPPTTVINLMARSTPLMLKKPTKMKHKSSVMSNVLILQAVLTSHTLKAEDRPSVIYSTPVSRYLVMYAKVEILVCLDLLIVQLGLITRTVQLLYNSNHSI